MCADRVCHLGQLAHQKVAGPVQHQDRLLLFGLHRHEAHARPRHCLADRPCVRSIGLAALDVGLHVRRRHEANILAELRQLSRPVMRGGPYVFESFCRLRILGVMPRPRRELAEAERPQFPADRRLAHRHAKLLPEPLHEVYQPPAHTRSRRDSGPASTAPASAARCAGVRVGALPGSCGRSTRPGLRH
jgi:hypothetical protein